MSRENVELVYAAYEAMRQRDANGFIAVMHPEVEATSYVMAAEGQLFRGHNGMRSFLENVYSVFPDWHPEVAQAFDYGDVVVAEITMAGRAAASGVEVRQTAWQAIRFRDGRLISWHGFGTQAEALKAVGL